MAAACPGHRPNLGQERTSPAADYDWTELSFAKIRILVFSMAVSCFSWSERSSVSTIALLMFSCTTDLSRSSVFQAGECSTLSQFGPCRPVQWTPCQAGVIHPHE